MKKTKLLALSTMLLVGVVAPRNVNAQTVIMSENFNAATSPALPSGWAQSNAVTGASGWNTGLFSSLSSWGLATGTTLPSHPTQVAFVNDWDAGTTAPLGSNTADTLKSPVFSLASATSPYLNFESFYYNAVLTSSGVAEKAKVLGSTDGGATWVVLDTVYPSGWDGVWNTQHISLSALGSGPNNKIAFTYVDGGGKLLGLALDNVQVINLNTNDAAITALDYNSKTNGISANGQPVSFTIENRGVPISSLLMYYSINGGAPVVQNFTGLSLTGYASQNFTFTTPIAGAAAGSNTVRVGIISVNGLSNAEPVDTVQTSSFMYASAAVPRNGLLEQFTSATSAPCASFNSMFDPVIRSLHADSVGGNFNLIKYQMNWPFPGTDRSYNADANTRKGYYGVASVPIVYANGAVAPGLLTSAPLTTTVTNVVNAASANDAFLDITATYLVDTLAHKVHVVTNVTPHFTKTGNYHVYAALLDKYYYNSTSTTSQHDFYHVMRKMLPAATGHVVLSWVDGVTQTFYDTGVAYTNGNWMSGASSYPLQGSNTFWANPLLNSELVTFVQEDVNKSVMQSLVVTPCMPPSATISGGTGVCLGNTLTLTASVSGGTWLSSSTGIATVDGSTGVVTSVAAGTTTISYMLNSMCGVSTVAQIISVDTMPDPATISGATSVCQGATIALTGSSASGSWYSSTAGVATVSSTGVVTGVAGGTAYITYDNSNSCGAAVDTQMITVNPLPDAGAITAPDTICVGSTLTITESVSGGTWTSTGGHTTIGAGGVLMGTSAGAETISYSVTNSCGTTHATRPVYVKVCVMDGVEQISANTDIKLHPNPTHDIISITSSANIGNVIVTNMVGQKVHEARFNANAASVNMSAFPDGVYFIRVNDSKVFKVVKH